MGQSAARTIVKRDAGATAVPTVTDAEVDAILTETAYAVAWSSAQTYEFGQRIMPITRNGRIYQVVKGGTSGTTEPSWPTGLLSRVEATGGTAIFEVAAPDVGNVWDLRAATHRVWLLKAAKASELSHFAEDGQSFDPQQVYDHCVAMAQRWQPFVIA